MTDSCYGDYGENVTECAECQFDYERAGGQDFAASAGPIADEYVDLLESTSVTMLRSRPSLHMWSPLEYACHVRDLLLVQRERVLAARRQDRPAAEPMGRDERSSTTDTTANPPAMLRVNSAMQRYCYRMLSADYRPPTGNAPRSTRTHTRTPTRESVHFDGLQLTPFTS